MVAIPPALPTRDLDDVLETTRSIWNDLANARIFITGGTGFFGTWLLESFAYANDRLNLNSSLVVLTRDPDAFRRKAPHLVENDFVSLVKGDVLDPLTGLGSFDAVIHAATSASADLERNDPETMFSTIVSGTDHVIDMASESGEIPFLLTSSGAVYGRQPADLEFVTEDWRAENESTDSLTAYARGKREAELRCLQAATRTNLQMKIARCYAFVGPHLPLDRHFAIGNFIRDGIDGRPIEVKGDGTTVRSYLYASDLVAWLWTILVKGEPGRPYNVGSSVAITMAELAQVVAIEFNPAPAVTIAEPPTSKPTNRYVPSVERARDELGLKQQIELSEAIARTVEWYPS